MSPGSSALPSVAEPAEVQVLRKSRPMDPILGARHHFIIDRCLKDRIIRLRCMHFEISRATQVTSILLT